MEERYKVVLVRFWRQWLKPFVIILLVLSCLRSAVADWYDVPTGSMKPTIMEGDRIFTNKLAYDLKVPFTTWRIATWAAPQRSDVVVFYAPHSGKRMVKRIVGLPGDRIHLRGNRLFVNGRPASYAELDQETIDQIPTGERELYRFRAEELAEAQHPVMMTPSAFARRYYGPVRVPQDHYFVMGDNRDNSNDSRVFGFVHRDQILGRSSLIVLSLDKSDHYRPRWQRFFRRFP